MLEKTIDNLVFEMEKEALDRGIALIMPTAGKSMFPLLTGRDRIVILKCDERRLRRGDLVLFRRNNEGNIYVTHRLMRKIKNGHGFTLITKGDAQIHCDRAIDSDLLIGKIIKIKTPYFSISLEGITGRIINTFMLLISLTRVVGLGLLVLRKVSAAESH